MEGERTITTEHTSLVGQYANATSTWSGLNGWTQINPNLLFHEASVDLSGYAMEDLTMYVEELGLQDPGIYSFIAGAGATYSGIQVLDLITSVPMTEDDLTSLQNNATVIGPGMLGSVQNFEQIVLGTYRFFTPNSLIAYPGYQQLARTQRFDSGEPNASDKLFSYRIVILLTDDLDDNSVLLVPACRQLVGSRFFKEEFLHYMMRLKRSYELANQV